MRLETRIKRMEEAVGATHQPPVILWQEPGETDEECYRRHGVEEDPDRLNILIVKWGEGPAELPLHQEPWEPAGVDVDQEIEAILCGPIGDLGAEPHSLCGSIS